MTTRRRSPKLRACVQLSLATHRRSRRSCVIACSKQEPPPPPPPPAAAENARARRRRGAHRDRAGWRARAVPRVRQRRTRAGVHPRLVLRFELLARTGARVQAEIHAGHRGSRRPRRHRRQPHATGPSRVSARTWPPRCRRVPNKQIILVGHSMGGPVAHRGRAPAQGPRHRHHRRRHLQVDRRPGARARRRSTRSIKPFEADFIGQTRTLVDRAPVRQGRPSAARAEDRLRHVAVAAARRPCPSMRAVLEYDFTEPLKDISVPIVAINSDLGEPVNEARIRKVLPKFRAVTLAGDGHFLMMEDPAALQSGAGNGNPGAARRQRVARTRMDARSGGGDRRRTRGTRPARARASARDHAAVRPGVRRSRHEVALRPRCLVRPGAGSRRHRRRAGGGVRAAAWRAI